MKKRERIKKNKEFSYVFERGRSVANRQFVLYVCPKEGQTHFRLGLSVNKRIGNAVTRNRVKRYIREVFHEMRDFLEQNKYGLLLWSFVIALWWWRIGSHWLTNNVIKPFITI